MSNLKVLYLTTLSRSFLSHKIYSTQMSTRTLKGLSQLRGNTFSASPLNFWTNNFYLCFSRHNSEKTKANVCWKCGIDVGSIFFCEKCHHIQKPNINQNYFELFGVSCNFLLETKDLTQKYRKILNELHPDRFSSKEDDEKELSEEYSSLINKAYTTLLNPLDRGMYLLQLEGISIEEDAVTMDAEVLMNIMEMNEELEEADSEETFLELKANIQKDIDKLIRETNEAYLAKDFNRMKVALSKMKYYESIVLKMKEKKQELNIPN